jgi:hypothetical protein
MSLKLYEVFLYLASKYEISDEARSAFVVMLTAVSINLAVFAFLAICVQRILVAYWQDMHVLLNACGHFLHLNYRFSERHHIQRAVDVLFHSRVDK